MAMDLQTIQLAAKALSQVEPTSSVSQTPSVTPDAGTTNQFKSLMTPADEVGPAKLQADPAVAAQSDPSLPSVQPVLPTQPVNAGEAILQGIDSMRSRIESNWTTLTTVSGAGEKLSVSDLMQFQMKAIETTTQIDFASKLVSKSEQNLEQLVKMS